MLKLCGRKRKIVVKKEEVMYIPLLETLQALLHNTSVGREVSFVLLILVVSSCVNM